MNLVAIVQGRLSPPPPHRIQAFPWGDWEHEFDHARDLGIDGIEWLFEVERYDENPLFTRGGPEAIRRRVSDTGICVPSVCADYFMTHPFFRVSEHERKHSIDVLLELISRSADVGATTVLLPVLEISEIRTETERDLLLDSLERPLESAARCGVRLGFETELPRTQYRALVELRRHPNLGIYYDVGNSTAAGHDAATDLAELAPHLVGIHVKDRRRGGPTVPLGQGDTDYPAVFNTLQRTGYAGHFTLQAASGPDYLGEARRSVAFVRSGLAEAA